MNVPHYTDEYYYEKTINTHFLNSYGITVNSNFMINIIGNVENFMDLTAFITLNNLFPIIVINDMFIVNFLH